MADRNIDIRLVIDGKEAITTLNVTDAKVKEIKRDISVIQPMPNPIPTGAVQNVSAMNQTMTQLGWVVGDVNMFMVNFRMGMMSIGNNIPMVVQGLQRAREEAAELGITFKQSLMKSLMGAGGVMIGINALMFALQVIPALFENSSKKVDEQAEKVKNLADQYKNLAVVQLQQQENELQKQIALLEMENKSFEKKVYIGGYNVSAEYGVISRDQATTDRNITQIKKLKDELAALRAVLPGAQKNLEQILGQETDTRVISKIDKSIAALKLEYDNVTTDSERKALDSEMKRLELKKKSLERTKEQNATQNKGLFTSQAELEIDLRKLQAELAITNNLRDRLLLKQKIKDIEKDISSPFEIDSKGIKTKGYDKDNLPADVNNQLGARNGLPINPLTSWGADRLSKENPTLKYLEQEIDMTQTLGAVWQRTGSVMATSLSRSLGLFKQTNNVIKEILQSLAEMAIQMASMGLIKGIIGLATGGGFMSGFLDIFGGGKSVQAGGQSNMATPFMPVSSVRQFGSSQNININVSGSLIGKGTSLVSTFNKSQKIINKVY